MTEYTVPSSGGRMLYTLSASCTVNYLSLDDADLSGANLAGITVRNASLNGTDISNADFSLSSFTYSDFRNVNMRGSNFRDADLRCAYIDPSCDYDGADFTGASFLNANLPPDFFATVISHFDIEGRDAAGYNSDGYNSDGYNRSGYNRRGYNRSGYDSDGYDEYNEDRNGNTRCGNEVCECEAGDGCREAEYDEYDDNDDNDDSGNVLNSYSYKPEWNFYATDAERANKGNAYYGMEIEVTCEGNLLSGVVARALDKISEKRVCFKEDSSVEGFEMVTHPMTYAYAMTEFPWDVLTDFDNAGCEARPSDNGIHIHVNRKGFSDSPHLFRWMKFFYRNEKAAKRIARRDSSWGMFTDEHRDAQMAHVKKQKLLMAGRRSASYNITDHTADERYSAINTQNTTTLEVRIFASTLDVATAKSALQFVAATVEYTRVIDSKSVAMGAWDWSNFRAWLMAYAETYPELAELERVARTADIEREARREWLNNASEHLTFTEYVAALQVPSQAVEVRHVTPVKSGFSEWERSVKAGMPYPQTRGAVIAERERSSIPDSPRASALCELIFNYPPERTQPPVNETIRQRLFRENGFTEDSLRRFNSGCPCNTCARIRQQISEQERTQPPVNETNRYFTIVGDAIAIDEIDFNRINNI